MSLTKMIRFRCDGPGCERTCTVEAVDAFAGEVELLKRHWKVVRMDFYGNTGHFCNSLPCQEEADRVRFRDDSV